MTGTVAHLGVLQAFGSAGARGNLAGETSAKSARVRGTRGELWRWDLQSGRADVVYASDRALLTVSASPAAGLLAHAGSELSLYDRRKERPFAFLGVHDMQLNGAVFAPDESLRLASPTHSPNQVRVWDLKGCGVGLSGSELQDLVEARTGLRVVGFQRVFAPDPVDRERLRELVRWERE